MIVAPIPGVRGDEIKKILKLLAHIGVLTILG